MNRCARHARQALFESNGTHRDRTLPMLDDAGVNGRFRRAPASAQNMKTPKASA
jgi:hypothetical protein